jgi:hypothetical protein
MIAQQEKSPGQIAYEAAQKATGCSQPWEEANREKWEAAANAVIAAEKERCAKIADYWGAGNWKYNGNGRLRFNTQDMQAVINTTARAIAEDIRDTLKERIVPPSADDAEEKTA